jgi:hypothetical protein
MRKHYPYDNDDLLTASSHDSHNVNGVKGQTNRTNVLNPTRRQSWMSTSTGDIIDSMKQILDIDHRVVEKFKIMLKPPEFDNDDILCAIQIFMRSITDYIPSIKQDKTFTVSKSIRSMLDHPETVRFFGLMIHYCYWNIIHPLTRNIMNTIKQQTIQQQQQQQVRLFQDIDMLKEWQNRQILPKALTEKYEIPNNHRKTSNTTTNTTIGSNKSREDVDHLFNHQLKSHTTIDPEKDAMVDQIMFQKQPFTTHNRMPVEQFTEELDHQWSLDSLSTNASLSLQEKENLYLQLETSMLVLFRKVQY